LLQQEQKKNTNNLIPVYLENYIDFLTVYTSDSREAYNKLHGNKDLRMELLKQGDNNSPWYLFTAAEINMQWATMSIRFGDYLTAIMEIRKAYKFLEENKERFPDFRANKKSLGVLYALLGSVPDKYKWGVSLLGMEGSVQQGLKDLNDLIAYGKQNDYIFMEETITLYAFLLFHLQNDSEKAWEVLKANNFPAKDNLMNVFTCAHIGVYGKHTDEALQLLEAKPNGADYADFPLVTYLHGLAKLHKLSADADSYFKKFIAENKGESHLKSSFQKIAWSYLLKGDTVNYRSFIAKAGKKGTHAVEADKQAQKEFESGAVPNVNLLRARLLFDGGYYQKATDEMAKLNEKNFQLPEESTEYFYRLGRIYHEWNKPDSALLYYEKAIEKGKALPRYFAANAALASAQIYEQKGNKEKAISFYQLCLSFEEHEYKNGIDQKAKAALNRLN
jgi:tetratricopeptide (TPR) repeat protein